MKKNIMVLTALLTLSTVFTTTAFAKSYEVKQGDTLSQIAKDNNTSIDELIADNHISNRDLIFSGENLEIRDNTEYTEALEVAEQPVVEYVAPVEEYIQESVLVEQPVSQGYGIGSFNITFYSAYDGTQIGITAGGTNMAGGNVTTAGGYRIVAVDRNVIPLGTVLKITLADGTVIMGQADDTGGAIKGNRIDVAVSSSSEAFAFGRTTATVEIVE